MRSNEDTRPASRKAADFSTNFSLSFIIKDKFNNDFQPQWLNQYFINISDKTIFVIDILPNNKPIFLDKQFFVRTGNVTQLLEGESVPKFIRNRFPKY